MAHRLPAQEIRRPKSKRLPRPAAARGSPSRSAPALRLLHRSRDPSPARRANTAANQAGCVPAAKLLFLDFAEGGVKLRRGLPHVQPVKKRVRRLQPDAEPLRDFLLLFAFLLFHFAVARNHFRPALPEAR